MTSDTTTQVCRATEALRAKAKECIKLAGMVATLQKELATVTQQLQEHDCVAAITTQLYLLGGEFFLRLGDGTNVHLQSGSQDVLDTLLGSPAGQLGEPLCRNGQVVSTPTNLDTLWETPENNTQCESCQESECANEDARTYEFAEHLISEFFSTLPAYGYHSPIPDAVRLSLRNILAPISIIEDSHFKLVLYYVSPTTSAATIILTNTWDIKRPENAANVLWVAAKRENDLIGIRTTIKGYDPSGVIVIVDPDIEIESITGAYNTIVDLRKEPLLPVDGHLTLLDAAICRIRNS